MSEESESESEVKHEPSYDKFICPLTKEVMRDPVTLEETHNTFEREAIEDWFRDCKRRRVKPSCPLTKVELRSTHLNPSVALRNTIERWNKRNDATLLEFAHNSLSPGSSESQNLFALKYIQDVCVKSRVHKHAMRETNLIPQISSVLKSNIMSVRCKALQTIRVVVEDDDDNKEAVAVGDTIRTIVKFLSRGLMQERQEAVMLLCELSKIESLSEKIGAIDGAILLLVGMASSKAEDTQTIEKAELTLSNLERFEANVLQMAKNGRLKPLLRLLLEGSPETQFSMISFLGDHAFSNNEKVEVATTAGYMLVNFMRSGTREAREASLKTLNQISSCEKSPNILIEAGILPPLVRDLFSVGTNQVPTKLKEFSATILANIVASNANFKYISLDHTGRTLVSEDTIHNLLQLISNAGPAIECKLLQVLVGITNQETVMNVVASIKSLGAITSLVQFIGDTQWEIRLASVKLLKNISPYMNRELASILCGSIGELRNLIKIIIAENNGISEEQAAAIGILAELPVRDPRLTSCLLNEGVFPMIIYKVHSIRQGQCWGGRFVMPYLEGLVRILSRLTYVLESEHDSLTIACEHNLTALFTDLLHQTNGDDVQIISAMALENLSMQSIRLTRIPDVSGHSGCGLFQCFFNKPTTVPPGLCKVHNGICSAKDSFCLLEGKTVGKLVGCLDHANEKLVEASLSALCTLLHDSVDVEQGVLELWNAHGISPIIKVLIDNTTEILVQKSVWAVEKILRTDDISNEIADDQDMLTALVEAFQHGDHKTKQVAERALKRVDKLPNFSGIFQKNQS
ncbi:U-box domain-containing protein 44 [Zostera marina]|uniref:RING-type E3 ubiquitin transferase n=1 Tax=Zostera marina TaxID=29655 RepID=A0A0K9NMA7_ZOSMR|nr:U-box domain-containing protein 44 [Zostera marina]